MHENLPAPISLLESIKRAQAGMHKTASLWADIEVHIREAERQTQHIKQKIAALTPVQS